MPGQPGWVHQGECAGCRPRRWRLVVWGTAVDGCPLHVLPFAKVCWFRSPLTAVAGAQSGFGEWNVWWVAGWMLWWSASGTGKRMGFKCVALCLENVKAYGSFMVQVKNGCWGISHICRLFRAIAILHLTCRKVTCCLRLRKLQAGTV